MSDASLSTNWAGNITYRAAEILQPTSAEEIATLVQHSQKVNALGSRHTFNTIADNDERLISLSKLDSISIDIEKGQATIGGGVRYGPLCEALDAAGFALPNLASLPHISVAGACMTGTHGSGVRNGNLATAVSALKMVTAAGDTLTHSKDRDPDFYGAVVSLGALGIVTELTLDLEPSFEMRQVVYENLPLSAALDHFEEIMAAEYSVSLFTDWQTDRIEQVWLKARIPAESPPPDFYGATAAAQNLHPIGTLSGEPCTPQMGSVGPWYNRLPHFQMAFTPSHGEELQSEYFVPLEHGAAAVEAVHRLGPRLKSALMISEIRTIAADELWLSPHYQRGSAALHFTWHRDWERVQALLPLIEEALMPFQPRPHWGKLFTLDPQDFAPLYPKLPAFLQLADRLDPAGKFRNRFLQRTLFAQP